MRALFDVFFTCIKVGASCFTNRNKLANRSWRGEFIFRLAKSFLSRSIGKEFTWIRTRQKLLTLYSPDLLKVRSEKIFIAGVTCLSVQTKQEANPSSTIIYFHGGGYAVGSADGYHLMAAKIALKCQAKVIVVDYRLVPEFALPTAQDDCYAVTQYVLADKTHKVLLMGDSAGGALCLSMLKRLKAAKQDESLSRLAGCALISPWVAPLSYKNLSLENEASDMLDRHITQCWVDTFYQSEAQGQEVDLSDIQSLGLAKKDWPPLYIQAAGAEVFLKQVQTLSDQLASMTIQHEFEVFADQFHVFQTFSPIVPEANDALNKIAGFVRSV